jgi:hypothetical protein
MITKSTSNLFGTTPPSISREEMSIKDGQINVTLSIKNFIIKDTDVDGKKNIIFNFELDGIFYSGNFVIEGSNKDDESTLDRIMNQLTAYVARVIMIEIMAKKIMGNKKNKFDGNVGSSVN